MAEAKRQLSLRVSQAGADYVDEVAAQFGVSQAIVLRALFSVGTMHKEEALAKLKALKEMGDLE